MVPNRCIRFGLPCGVIVAALAWPVSRPALAQTVNEPRYALHVDRFDGRVRGSDPWSISERYGRPRDSGPYGYAHARRRGYGYPYVIDGGYVWPRGQIYRWPGYGYYGYSYWLSRWAYKGPWIDDHYRQWRYRTLTRRSKKRTERLLKTHGLMMSRGLEAFSKGQYERARSAFALAADMNIFDAASRIHAAHACFALRRYSQAVGWLRKAFALEPRIRELPYDIRTDYGRPGDFDEQLAALKASVEALPGEIDPAILLGYVSFYTGQRAEAYGALCKAKERLAKDVPKDELISILLKACEPSRFVARKPDG